MGHLAVQLFQNCVQLHTEFRDSGNGVVRCWKGGGAITTYTGTFDIVFKVILGVIRSVHENGWL